MTSAQVTNTLPRVSPYFGPNEYGQLVARIRQVARGTIPRSATVLVVSRGDDQLLELDGPRGWHFPRTPGGEYAGYHPSSSGEAIDQIEALRELGAGYLLFPSTAFWWLGYYEGLTEHLRNHYQLVHADDATCVIFALNGHEPVTDVVGAAPSQDSQPAQQLWDLTRSVLPEDASVLLATSRSEQGLGGAGFRVRLFPLDPSDDQRGAQRVGGMDAIQRLTQLQQPEATFLIIPQAEFGWLDARADFRRHLETRHRLVLHERHVCTIYELSETRAEPSRAEAAPQERKTIRRRLADFWKRS